MSSGSLNLATQSFYWPEEWNKSTIDDPLRLRFPQKMMMIMDDGNGLQILNGWAHYHSTWLFKLEQINGFSTGERERERYWDGRTASPPIHAATTTCPGVYCCCCTKWRSSGRSPLRRNEDDGGGGNGIYCEIKKPINSIATWLLGT